MTIEKKRRRLDRRRGILTLDGVPFDFNSKKYNLGVPGSCYVAAWKLALDLELHGVPAGCMRIAHGVVSCRNQPSEWFGMRIMHGWVEWKINGCWLVIDASRTGHPVWLGTRDQYYEAAEVRECDLWLYSTIEACELASRLEHYGPWRKPKVAADDWSAADEAKLDANGFYVDP